MNCLTDHNAALPAGHLHTADQAVVRVDGAELRVVRYGQFDVPLYFVHASLPEGGHRVEVTIKRHHTRAAVHPKRLGIKVDAGERRRLAFTIRDNPHLVVECDGLGYLFLAFDPLMEEPAGPGILSAVDAGIDSSSAAVQTEVLQAAIDRVSADEGLHTLLIPAGLYRTGDLHLKGDCRIHLAGGAVLKASDSVADFQELETVGSDGTRHCMINARDAANVAVTGHGHIDGNRAVLDLGRYFNGMVKLDRCRNVSFEGVVLSDSCGWNTHFYACEDVLARRVKVLNNRPLVNCINTDGINPNACRRVRIDHCLMHTGDDAVAVKSCSWRRDMHPGHEAMMQDTADITVTDLLAVNNSTTAKIGTETDSALMENITFRRIDAVRTSRLCGIDAFDNSLVRNVRFEDCHVHHFDDTMTDRRLIDLNTPAEAFREIIGKSRIFGMFALDGGTMEHILVDNIAGDTNCREAWNRPIHLDASKRTDASLPSTIRNVSIRNFSARTDGRVILTAADGCAVEDITLDGLSLDYPVLDQPDTEAARLGKSIQCSRHSPEARVAPAALVVDGVKRFALRNLKIRWPEGPPPPDWMTAHEGGTHHADRKGRNSADRFAVLWQRDSTQKSQPKISHFDLPTSELGNL